MQFNFFLQTQANNNNTHHQQQKPWGFTYLGGRFQERVKSPPTNSVPLSEIKKGTWVQIVALPRHQDFPLVGVAVGTYLSVLGVTDRGAVRVLVIGQQVTLSKAIAQQIYVRPLYFTN